MISSNTLQEISDKKGIDKYSILREIIQIQFLDEIYKFPKSKQLFFKGGTALKIIFGSNRFSEDLDFTTDLNKNEIDDLVSLAIIELQKEYPEIGVRDLDTVKGISKKISLPNEISPQALTIKLDFSQRENVILPKISTIRTDLPILSTSLIHHLADTEIFAEKYRAITNRVKGRDLYDFLFLLKKNVKFEKNLINEKLKYYNEKFEPEIFIEKIKNWSELELDQDVRKFLPTIDRQIIPEIKNLIIKFFLP